MSASLLRGPLERNGFRSVAMKTWPPSVVHPTATQPPGDGSPETKFGSANLLTLLSGPLLGWEDRGMGSLGSPGGAGKARVTTQALYLANLEQVSRGQGVTVSKTSGESPTAGAGSAGFCQPGDLGGIPGGQGCKPRASCLEY